MKRIVPYLHHGNLQKWVANTQALSWLVIVLSVLICIVISWLHIKQVAILARTTLAVETMHKARIDLAQGFLHLSLATDETATFEREQDLVLMAQALVIFAQMVSQTGQEDQFVNRVQADVHSFRTQLQQWRDLPGHPLPTAALRMAYRELAQQGSTIDLLLREQLRQLNRRLYVIYFWTLSIAALLLAGICILNYYNNKAKTATEASLREREAKYRTLFDNMAQGVFYQSIDGTISEINDAALTMLGLPRDEALRRTSGNSEWQVIEEDGSPVAAEQHPSWQALQTGKVVRNRLLGVFNLSKQDFTWVIINAIPQFKADAANPYQVFVTFHDITERKATEQALRQEKDRFQKIVETAPGVVHAYRQRADGSINFPYASPRITEIYGLSPAQLAQDAAPILTLWHPDDVEKILSTVATSLQTNTPWHVEFRVRHPTKGEIWVEGRSIPQHEADGSILWYGVLTEVTDRKAAEAAIHQLNEELEARVIERTNQLQAANQELEAFAYSVSHDLRAPLRAIDGYTRILVEDYAPKLDAEALRLSNIICTEAQRMGQLIDDLLSFSRIGRVEVYRATLQMTQLVQDTFTQLRTEQPALQINFQLNALPATIGDLAMIRQVWQNLLANAIKFTSKRDQAIIEVGGVTEQGRQHLLGTRQWCWFRHALCRQTFWGLPTATP